jgi:hypothetical protein
VKPNLEDSSLRSSLKLVFDLLPSRLREDFQPYFQPSIQHNFRRTVTEVLLHSVRHSSSSTEKEESERFELEEIANRKVF